MKAFEIINDRLKKHTNYIENYVTIGLSNSVVMIPGGHNGPYLHPETPIRNTCHTIVLLLNVYPMGTKIALVEKLVRYLVEDNPYYKNGQFLFRSRANDTCNGVIGDAWVLEALCKARSNVSADLAAKVDAIISEILLRMTFSSDGSYAYRYDYDKGKLSADFTYNHQLWLYTSLVDVDESWKQKTALFLDHSLNRTLRVRDDGLINHLFFGFSLKNLYNRLRYYISEKKGYAAVNYKERGYHLFNLFAFARLYQSFPEHEFFKSDKFLKILKIVDYEFVNRLYEERNKYAIYYNNPLFELSYIYKIFSSSFELNFSDADLAKLVELDCSWNDSEQAFTNNFQVSSNIYVSSLRTFLLLQL